MSVNKKIHYGDNFRKSINEDIIKEDPLPPSQEGKFSFDSTTITFDTLLRTFDET